ncbi:MAG: MoaD/ThiS family protein [Flammeovirgaceae bacterium]
MAKVIIPTPLRKFVNNQAEITAIGANVQESIEGVATQFPEIKPHLFDAEGNIRSFVRIYVGDEDIKALNDSETAVTDSSVISIIPAIAGGSF